MKNLSFFNFSRFFCCIFYVIILSLLSSILFNCVPKTFMITQQAPNRSIAIIYIEVFEKKTEVQKTGNLGNKSYGIFHFSGKMSILEAKKCMVRKLEAPFMGLEYTHALVHDPISDKILFRVSSGSVMTSPSFIKDSLLK